MTDDVKRAIERDREARAVARKPFEEQMKADITELRVKVNELRYDHDRLRACIERTAVLQDRVECIAARLRADNIA